MRRHARRRRRRARTVGERVGRGLTLRGGRTYPPCRLLRIERNRLEPGSRGLFAEERVLALRRRERV